MAGCIGRYFTNRYRARIELVGLRPWGALVGQVLTVIDQGGDAQEIESVITLVEWQLADGDQAKPRTIIHTGYGQ